ncbi:unnamed protein product [Phyllotreta striolata]|uniref:CAP-Gly domain-containing protein n=1 Tax=Phyllotreta striolata TaxID=444603 RepID=A0A9N9THH0_PHYSR|nr:unnamed protein product [Phyllotreta striolata]
MEHGGECRREPSLETVRALHQTVVALRAALEESKSEILKLKNSSSNPKEAVTLENRLLKEPPEDQASEAQNELGKEESTGKKVTIASPKRSTGNIEARISIKRESTSPTTATQSLESLTILKSPLQSFTLTKTFNFSRSSSRIDRKFNRNVNEMTDKDQSSNSTEPNQNDLDQTEEVDDIELIFTTDETKESDFKEQLVSIDPAEGGARGPDLLRLPLGETDLSDKELDDDVFNDNEHQDNSHFRRDNSQICDSKSDVSINQEKSAKSYYSLQDSSFENRSIDKDESFDRFEERIRIIETDISKCGIHDVEYVVGRRNTCPNPLQYRPLLHREALSKSGRRSRPILTQSNAVRKDSGAQTDISAIPGSQWRSESSLANKSRLGDNFTTLPSKLPLPGSRLRLSEKTVEARRVLLSDIGFTSMVPELSRSADHLFPAVLKPTGVTPTYGQFLKTTDLYSPGGYVSQKFTWSAATASPSEASQSQSQYGSLCPLNAASRRCSAPVSPSRRAVSKQAPSKVRFANGSLPELRGDWSTLDSGDSTDSLVEEAENYLRRSIDCIVTGRDTFASYCEGKTKTGVRRASAPEPSGDNVPPPGWVPFLPRVSRDLKLDNWVKVITSEGRVKGGRVRYVGPVTSQTEHFVGVQLGSPDGYCDGTFNNRKYFQCEPYHGIFVPFRKVIMGWRP